MADVATLFFAFYIVAASVWMCMKVCVMRRKLFALVEIIGLWIV